MIGKVTTPKKTFSSQTQEAVFWEKNFEALWAKAKPIQASISDTLTNTLTLSLKPSVMRSINREAKIKGIEPDRLIRLWIDEKIGKQPKPLTT